MGKNEISGNFIIQCKNNSLFDSSCAFGILVLIISIILLLLNLLAFIKMTKFYKKMNFENTIILLSIFQTIILETVLISSYDIIFESFFLVQIFIISLIIRKFNILASDPKTFFEKNGVFILLNFFNISIFLIYPLYLNIFRGHHLYVKLFYRIYHGITTCILTYYCRFFINLVGKYKENYLKSYYNFYEANLYINNNETTDTKNNDNMIENNNKESLDCNHQNNINDNKSKSNSINTTGTDNENEKTNDEKGKKVKKKGERFYHEKKKQIRYLFSVNLLCAFIEICFTIIRNFILYDYYENDDYYKTIPNSTKGEIIYFFYLIVCLLNVSVNYLCFFFFIRNQYSRQQKKFIKSPDKKILDENFIEEEKNIKKSNNPEVNSFLFNSSASKRKDEEAVSVNIKEDDFESLNKLPLLPNEMLN